MPDGLPLTGVIIRAPADVSAMRGVPITSCHDPDGQMRIRSKPLSSVEPETPGTCIEPT